jgi:energy-coupling factor transport system permease protein
MKSNVSAWLIWTIAVAALVMTLENPWYTLIILLVTRLMVVAYGREEGFHFPLWRAGAIILIFSALYQAAFVHVGDTVLFRLPPWPLVGGPVTLEAIVDGLGNGLTLLALLSLFLALGAIVPVSDLLRLAPAGLQDAGVVILIAVTYIPQTRRHLSQIREAQAIRGHTIRGLRDWRPVVVPLLVGGLERAMLLAETMVARGYGATSGVESSHLERLGLGAALVLAAAGWLLAWIFGGMGWSLVFVGLGIVAALLWRRGRRTAKTHYRSAPWTLTSSVLVGVAAIAVLVFFLPLTFLSRASLSYSAFPALAVPGFELAFGLVLVMLALPAVIRRPRRDGGRFSLAPEPVHDSD